MTTTLPNGTRVPDVASTNWAGDLEVNWQLLDAALGAIGSNVKTNRPNTWTAEQTFSEPIIGNLTGTASKAGADEDGTSIKTGYVNVAGNQTVTGDKSWTGSNTFNSILPNATNSYSLGSSSYQWSSVYAQSYYYNGTAWGLDKVNEWSNTNRFLTSITLKNTSLEKGVAPSSASSKTFFFTDKNNATLATIIARTNPSGSSYLSLVAENLYKNGAMDSTGSAVKGGFFVGITAEGNPFCDASGDLFPEYNNTYKLGTSTNQWSSVYAQTYYYNGTAWGLDKENVWSAENTFTSNNINIKRPFTLGDNTYQVARLQILDSASTPQRLGTFNFVHNTRNISRLEIGIYGLNSNNEIKSRFLFFQIEPDETSYFAPVNSSQTNLGSSTNKWKTLNGINPGALSLPDINTSIAVDTTNWVYDGATFNEIKINNATQTISGWLYIIINNASSDDVIVVRYAGSDSGNLTYAQYKSGLSYVSLVAPIMPGVKTYVASRKAFSTIKIYSCLGNV